MSRLVVVIGDYSGGTVEDTLAHDEINADKKRSGDSADGRVFNELIRQNPDVSHVVTLPVTRQFSPNSASILTRKAVEFGMDVLENPNDYPQYHAVDEVTILANVAPGVKSLSGDNVSNAGNNLDRESFILGTVQKNGHKIHVGSTNAFFDTEGHTLGDLANLPDEYQVSPFKPIGGDHVQEELGRNNQFRSRWALPYMATREVETIEPAQDILEIAREQYRLVPDAQRRRDEADAEAVYAQMQSFLPVRSGNAREGFVTIISDEQNLEAKLDEWKQAYPDALLNGLALDGNETVKDRTLIQTLSGEDQEKYRLTRQALLASNLANEFDKPPAIEHHTVIVDSVDSQHQKPDEVADVTLSNGSHILTSRAETLALTLDSIESISLGGQRLDEAGKQEFLQPASDFQQYLSTRAVEVDPYRNVKLGRSFGEQKGEILEKITDGLTESGEIPEGKAVKLSVAARTGNEEQQAEIYLIPHNSHSFGGWGFPKFSGGSTKLTSDPENLSPGKARDHYQAEIFTPGCPTAGNLFQVIPGVTQFEIKAAELVNNSLFEQPRPVLTGKERSLDGAPVPGIAAAPYTQVHGKYVQRLLDKNAAQQDIGQRIAG